MKAKSLSIGLLALACLATGCDNISEDERHLKVEKPVVDNPRTLLIMEFTGNSCLNCPTGATIVEQIKQDEPAGRVISVGLHPYGSHFTEPLPSLHTPTHMQDLRCQAATAIYDYYQPSGFPTAIFNGFKSSMSGVPADWILRAKDALTQQTYVTLTAECDYDPESRNLTVDYEVQFNDIVKGKLNVTVWLVENKIMGTQTMPDGKLNLNYEHNHVLRTSLNGDWGQPIGEYFTEETKINGSESTILQEDWVAENCDIVVYVYHVDNMEVEQAVSTSVIENSRNLKY